MALFLALGVLLLGEWLRNGDAKTLAVSVLFLAGSANTKNEGLMAAAVVFVVAGVVSLLGSRRGKTRQLVLGAAAFVAAILPWRIWLAVEGIHGDIPVRKALDPSYLADHASRIWPSAESLYTQLTSASGYYAIVLYEGGWLYAVPLAGALAFVCIFIRECRSLAAFYLASGVLAFAALVWVYWITPTEPLDVWLTNSAYRVVAVVVALAFAALLELTGPAPHGFEKT